VKRIAVILAAGLLLGVGAASAAISVSTFRPRPATIHLSHAPRCASLPYRLSARAEDVELSIVNARRREVWEADRKRTGISAGRVFSFKWCGQAKHGGKVRVGHYRWRIEVDQAHSDFEARSPWRTVRVLR
jgi:hypothetical protein